MSVEIIKISSFHSFSFVDFWGAELGFINQASRQLLSRVLCVGLIGQFTPPSVNRVAFLPSMNFVFPMISFHEDRARNGYSPFVDVLKLCNYWKNGRSLIQSRLFLCNYILQFVPPINSPIFAIFPQKSYKTISSCSKSIMADAEKTNLMIFFQPLKFT